MTTDRSYLADLVARLDRATAAEDAASDWVYDTTKELGDFLKTHGYVDRNAIMVDGHAYWFDTQYDSVELVTLNTEEKP